jgi:hypothetical protein
MCRCHRWTLTCPPSAPAPPLHTQGGAWTPIGDVTTTMLWLNGQLTPLPTMRDLLLPSLVALVVPLALLQLGAPEFKAAEGGGISTSSSGGSSSSIDSSSKNSSGPSQQQQGQQQGEQPAARPDLSLALTSGASLDGGASSSREEVLAFEEASKRGPLVLAVGLGALLSVPAFKYLTGLPPYMGVLSGLSVLWLLTDALHFGESRRVLTFSNLPLCSRPSARPGAHFAWPGCSRARALTRRCRAPCLPCAGATLASATPCGSWTSRRSSSSWVSRAPRAPAVCGGRPCMRPFCRCAWSWLGAWRHSLALLPPTRARLRTPAPRAPRPSPGILMAVGALEAAGLLQQLAVALSDAVPNTGVIAGAIGLVSALVDNVPLVAATMGMYDLGRVPADSQLWQMIALCAGAHGAAAPTAHGARMGGMGGGLQRASAVMQARGAMQGTRREPHRKRRHTPRMPPPSPPPQARAVRCW